MDPFTPFRLVARGCMGVGVGAMSERDLMSLSSIALVAGCFPPPTDNNTQGYTLSLHDALPIFEIL